MEAGATLRRLAPESEAEAAAALRDAVADGLAVRFAGAGTKRGWGSPIASPDVELSTRALDRIVEHNPGDLTAVLEPGVPLSRAQAEFAAHGQMLALDPPLGPDSAATVGGIVATADSGPLRHRYGAVRDLILGVTVGLSDGTVARSGGRVIKNVAGYDLAKLFSGSYGTLGAILQVTVRLQPLPEGTSTAEFGSDDPPALAAAAAALSHSRLDTLSLDIRWAAGAGTILARFGGVAGESQATAATRLLEEAVAPTIDRDDGDLWERQRAGQRGVEETDVVIRVAGTQSQLATALVAAERLGAHVVGRAALGILWVRVPGGGPEAVAQLRAALAPSPCVVLDAPASVRAAVDPWHEDDAARIRLMRSVKERFDPAGACNPGLFVDGI